MLLERMIVGDALKLYVLRVQLIKCYNKPLKKTDMPS